MTWIYHDESGEYGPDGKLLNMTIGACLSPLEKWNSFERDWRAALRAEGLSSFHMTDFEAWRAPFDFTLSDGSRDHEKHNRLLNALLDVMLANIEGFNGFGAVCAESTKHAVLGVYDWYQKPMSLVFGKQKHFSRNDIAKYIEFYDYGEASGRVKSLSMASPEDVPALQAADVLAYEIAHAQRRGRPERYPYQRLVDGAKANGISFLVHWGPIRSWRMHVS